LTGVFFWTLPIVLAWIGLGVLILIFFRVTKREEWLLGATEFAIEHEATVDELAELDREP
jgi:hypothetical protein